MLVIRNVAELSSWLAVRSPEGQRCPRSKPERAKLVCVTRNQPLGNVSSARKSFDRSSDPSESFDRCQLTQFAVAVFLLYERAYCGLIIRLFSESAGAAFAWLGL